MQWLLSCDGVNMASHKPNFLWPTNTNYTSTKGFWEGLRKRQLLAKKCRRCGEVFFPPRSHCPQCLGNDLEWAQLSDRGTLYSWTEVNVASPEFDTPFLLGLVDLSQGIGRMTARIVGAEAHQLHIGMPVRIIYADVDKAFTIYCIGIEP
ncbi:MAG: Zn-ribbon domain-containing OB-fold protein [Dehalococcoidia bacterium]|nr:Zn-ribbon domain-containing OB-fold protein [Dehalococcoidia bacterium]